MIIIILTRKILEDMHILLKSLMVSSMTLIQIPTYYQKIMSLILALMFRVLKRKIQEMIIILTRKILEDMHILLKSLMVTSMTLLQIPMLNLYIIQTKDKGI